MAGVNRQSGTVKWFDRQKGFGFILPDTGGEDVFVHQTCVQSDWYRNLSEGEVVEFIVEQCNDGRMKAIDVTGPEGAKISGVGRVGGGFRGGWEYGGGKGFGGGGAGGGGGGRGYGGRGPGAGSDGTCYTCGVVGHVARFCQENGGSGRSAGGCYSCGQPGHFARECPDSNGDRN